MKTNTYLTTLIERQQSEGWSDRRMAREAGIGHITWYRLRMGERQMGRRTLMRLMARFPEYNDLVLCFLRADVSESVENDASRDNRSAA